MASIGAGGVLYLSPLIFNSIGFTATQIGNGFGFAAVAGTLSRFIAGYCLDKGVRFSHLIRLKF